MRKEARQGRIACRIVNEGWRSSRVRTRTIKQLHAITQAQHPAKGSLWAGGRVEGGSTPKQAPIGGVGGGGSSTDLCYKCNQTTTALLRTAMHSAPCTMPLSPHASSKESQLAQFGERFSPRFLAIPNNSNTQRWFGAWSPVHARDVLFSRFLAIPNNT